MKNKRGLFIALILLLGVALTIGYAVLSQTLSVKGTTGIASNSWIIYFDHLMERPGTLTPTTPTTINAAKDRIDFTISLDKPGDNYTFEVDIINDGTIDAMIDTVSLTGIPEELEGIIEWKVNYLTGEELRKCDELLANSKRRIKVVVNYNKDIDELPEEQELDLQLSVKYVQLDNSICTTTNPPSSPDPIDPDDGRHTLTVDPNYGIYEGTDVPTIVRMVPGEVYVFGSNPIQEEHTFTGWTVEDSERYNETAGIITMDDEDISAIAGWNQNINPTTNEINCFRVDSSYFSNFNTALNSISEEGTIYLISNACTISERISIPEGKTITFDLNGHTVTHNEMIYNDGDLTITDTSDRKSGMLTANTETTATSFYILNNPTIRKVDDVEIHLVNATIQSAYTKLVDNLRGSVYIDGGEYTTQYELVLNNDKGSIYIENSTINIEGTNQSGDTAYVLHGHGYNKENVVFINNNVKIKSLCNSVVIVGFYAEAPESVEIHDVDIDIELLKSSTVWGIQDHTLGLKDDIEIDNFNMYVHNPEIPIGGAYGMEISGNKDVKVKNSSFKYDVASTSSQLTASTYHSNGNTILENVDVEVKLANGGDRINTMYGSNYEYNGGKVKIETPSINWLYGLYCTSVCNISNVDIDINVKNGGNTVYGAYFDGVLNYNKGSINIKANNVGTVYGIANFNNNGLADYVDVSIESHGNGATLCGMYMYSGLYKNSTLLVINDGNKNWYYKIYGAETENVTIND